ncbi:uncharacterized protein EMH_0043310 [Eimeria mitis]|uniref:UmuC domain-containing protein n=1 Tax=Eimeria mitis TaxID=44415 RepID=U6JXD1_9EIME|nr:uncharacterized protein EMH_0043310 [Eimeria mitis]CDJ28712.1 hypothetical protein EMH_0043310 [Eimeria mitis]
MAPPNCVPVFCHLDLDCFYCQVEHRRLGIPRHVPLAVRQWDSVIAVNYPARAMGVKRGQRVETVRSLCPSIELVHVETISARDKGDRTQPDWKADKVTLQRYRDASAEVLSLLLDYCQLVEKASIDEVYADLTPHAAALVLSLINEGPPSDTEDGGAPQPSPQGGHQPSPQGAPQPSPQGAPQPSPQGVPEACPQGAPQPSPQGGPQHSPQGGPQPASQGGPQPTVPSVPAEGPPRITLGTSHEAAPEGAPEGASEGPAAVATEGPPAVAPEGPPAVPPEGPPAVPPKRPPAVPLEGPPAAVPEGAPEGPPAVGPEGAPEQAAEGAPEAALERDGGPPQGPLEGPPKGGSCGGAPSTPSTPSDAQLERRGPPDTPEAPGASGPPGGPSVSSGLSYSPSPVGAAVKQQGAPLPPLGRVQEEEETQGGAPPWGPLPLSPLRLLGALPVDPRLPWGPPRGPPRAPKGAPVRSIRQRPLGRLGAAQAAVMGAPAGAPPPQRGPVGLPLPP